MKNKETLEEAKNNAWDNYEHTEGNLYSTSFKNGFELGAIWQQEQERMYSEEDLFKILLDFVAFPHDHMEPRGSIIERYLKELKNK